MLNNLENITNYLCNKYRHLEPESTKDILSSFFRVCKHELLNNKEIRIGRIGKFYVKTKAPKEAITIHKKKRIKPEMLVPFFRASSVFNDFINKSDIKEE